jgi:class 3 adenylate cyclase
MEPRIQYAKTSDGASIAFWSLGEGMPVVNLPVPLPFSHIQMEWQIPEWRGWYERVLRKRRVIRYDSRGAGLSDREVPEYSLDALVLDLEAVVDRLALEQFALLGFLASGPVAIAYATRHPERVSHLILWHSFTRVSDWYAPSGVGEVLEKLRDTDWELYTETVSHRAFGWSEGGASNRVAALLREALTPQMAQRGMKVIGEFDVTDLLPQVQAPTLVMHRRQVPWLSVDVAKELVSGIPDSRLVLLEGTSVATYLGDMEAVARAIDEFLDEGAEVAAVDKPAAPVGLQTILFTDIEGSTALTQRLGDAQAQELLHSHNTIVRDALKVCGGSEIKHTGDGIMASFPSASRAIECAVTIQRAVTAKDDALLRVRIGLNAGEPVAEDQDLFGTAVQLARRICDQAGGGAILVSNVVRELAMGKDFLFADTGEVALKGFEDPVRLYEVRWRE